MSPAAYPLLSAVDTPADLRKLPASKLPAFSSELREFLIQTVSTRGGHFAAGLGTVELTFQKEFPRFMSYVPEDRY